MSGGTFDYLQNRLDWEVIEPIQKAILRNTKKSVWISEQTWAQQGCRNWTDETIQEFHNGIEAIRRAYVYMQRIDWLLAGDDGEDTFHQRLEDDLANFKFPERDENDFDDDD